MLKSRGMLNGPWSGDKPIKIRAKKNHVPKTIVEWGGMFL